MNICGHIIHICSFIMHPNITFCFKEIQEDDGGNGFQFLYDKVFGEINWFTHCRQKAELVKVNS